jgi:hypothetical protein
MEHRILEDSVKALPDASQGLAQVAVLARPLVNLNALQARQEYRGGDRSNGRLPERCRHVVL